jgi:hypothetical protein
MASSTKYCCSAELINHAASSTELTPTLAKGPVDGSTFTFCHGQCAKLKLEGQPAVVPSGERPAVQGSSHVGGLLIS